MRMKKLVSITLAGASLVGGGLPAVARAQGNVNTPPPGNVNQAPEGNLNPQPNVGAEEVVGPTRAQGFVPGWQASAGAGTGFGGTYTFGVEGRVGYALPIGVYLGGDLQGYWGNSALNQQAHATFFGAEVGYEWFPINALEVRPYAFVGPAFVTQVSNAGVNSFTNVAFQPGALGMYHFGNAFAGADLRLMAAPAPFAATLMGTLGLGF